MNKSIMPTEAELKAELEKEMQGVTDDDLTVQRDISRDSPTTRDLIPRSRASFENHLKQLEGRIAGINDTIFNAAQNRDEAIARAEGHYKEFVHQAEKDLYQIKILKGAVELAIVALGNE